MYHFLRVTTEKIIPNAFNSKIDPDKEQIIDFCPRCNQVLKDKKVITLREHEKQMHPKTDKELIINFYLKGTARLFTVFLITGIVVVGFIGCGSLYHMIWESNLSMNEKAVMEFCNNLYENMPEPPMLYFGDWDSYYDLKSEYVKDNIANFEKCNYIITIYSKGNTEEQIKHFMLEVENIDR